MKVGKFLILPVLCWALGSLEAQSIRGRVRDADSGQPLAGALVELERDSATAFTTTTDSLGTFGLDGLRAGLYRCRVSAAAHETRLLPELDLAAGKERVLDFALRTMPTALPEVAIVSEAPGNRISSPLSEIPLSREQTLRFPATFFDPARLAQAYPGVANNDDQANGLSIRGNSPAAMRWRLEGVDIVNPNHLPNAGTFGDRPVPSAGGVLLFSAQLLDNSALLTGAFPAGYGDALGGIMDIGLRRGNNRNYEFTAQAGLLGLDVAAEGPIWGRGKNSFLVNYRYSTVGLLSDMGISFGDERIHFQDLSFKFSFSCKKGAQWSLFGLAGQSENIFDHKTDSTAIKAYKDFFDINFDSRTLLGGLSGWLPLGRKTSLDLSFVGSGQRNARSSSGAGLTENDESEERRAGLRATLSHRLNTQNRLLLGFSLQAIGYRATATRNADSIYQGDVVLLQAQPFALWEWSSRSGHTLLRAGLHGNILEAQAADSVSLDKTASLEPRLSLGQRFGEHQRLVLAYSLLSQASPLWTYAGYLPGETDFARKYPNAALGLARAHHLGLRYSWQPGERWVFRSELFYQWLYRVPVLPSRHTWSLINEEEALTLEQLQATGTGENKGLELSAERYLRDGWFLLGALTLLDSRYRGSDEVWREARWDLGHILNLTAGREWVRERRGERVRAFGFNGRLVWHGGQRAMPVDVAASTAAQTTVFDDSRGFTIRLPDFFRLDGRVYWRRSVGNRRNSTFAMEFQNLTLQQNAAYQYFDPFTERVEKKYQLGLVPNLSWRLEW